MRIFHRGPIVIALAFIAIAGGPRVARAEFVVSSVTLAGPTRLSCGGDWKDFTFTIKGSGAGKIVGTSLLWSVYEQDSGADDLLIDETRFVVSDDANGNYSFTQKFQLRCTKDCHIEGKSGQDDAVSRPAEVYVLIEHSLSGSDAGTSNILKVSCVEGAVPEPSSWALMAVGVGGLLLRARRRAAPRVGR